MSTQPQLPWATVPLLSALLGEQQHLGAAESFALAHARGAIDARASRYRSLMPAQPPAPGQQYAFEVDLDRCSGCKACVTGCHNRNGLDEAETWRSVGLMLGGDDAQPLLQHVTASCHHCVDPACLSGCPVRAYEKDPRTGIVRHLDDQCIGCQYCVMKCPYEVPQYNAARGIVRKCDMCTDRLAAGEAPACAQSCPSDAIRITLVDAQLDSGAAAARFAAVAGAPDAAYTRPTTAYLARARPAAGVVAPALEAAESHPSLVVMLTLTQAAIGAFLAAQLLPAAAPAAAVAAQLACAGTAAGMAAAILHLGRPQWAFRAVLGLRTSWLSREIVALPLFLALAAAASLAPLLTPALATPLAALAALAGVAAIHCSAMVYRDTPRPYWARGATSLRFFLTAAASGALALLLAHPFAGARPAGAIAVFAAIGATAKLVFEAYDRRRGAGADSRRLLAGSLRRLGRARLACAALCAVLLSLAAAAPRPGLIAALAGAAWLLGEAIERHLFFRAAVAPRMP